MRSDEIAMLATAAVREAEDGPAFVAEVMQRTGFEIRVLSGEEEARFSAEGVMAGAPLADGIMGDLGGGSLELVRIDGGKVTDLATLPLGPLRLLGETGGDGKVMRRQIEEALESLPWLEEGMTPHFYAVGGSWRNLARISMESRDYPLKVIHGYTMTASELEDLTRVVARQTKESLARLKNVHVAAAGDPAAGGADPSAPPASAQPARSGLFRLRPARGLAVRPALEGRARQGSAAGGCPRRDGAR